MACLDAHLYEIEYMMLVTDFKYLIMYLFYKKYIIMDDLEE
jgi:hypothetical protein